MNTRTLTLALFLLLLPFMGLAQADPEMADLMRKDGKIYTVVAVCLTILVGLFIFVTLTERKIARLEKKMHNKP